MIIKINWNKCNSNFSIKTKKQSVRNVVKIPLIAFFDKNSCGNKEDKRDF